MGTLSELLADEVKDLYSAEKQLVQALPKIARKVTNPELRRAIEDHLKQTEGHVRRLDQAAELMKTRTGGKKCKGMEGLLEEGNEVIAEEEAGEVRDAGIIGAAQRVEHYEIAGYGTARTHAQQLGLTQVAKLLQDTLQEEAEADKKLTAIAEGQVNTQAAQMGNGHNR